MDAFIRLEKIIDKVKSLFLYKIGTIIAGFADNIVISSFLGLKILALYENYYTIIVGVFSVLNIYYNSIRGGLGNYIASSDSERNYGLFAKLQTQLLAD